MRQRAICDSAVSSGRQLREASMDPGVGEDRRDRVEPTVDAPLPAQGGRALDAQLPKATSSPVQLSIPVRALLHRRLGLLDLEADLPHDQAQIVAPVIFGVSVFEAGLITVTVEINAGRPGQTGRANREDRATSACRGKCRQAHSPAQLRRVALGPHEGKLQAIDLASRSLEVEVQPGWLAD